MFRVAPSVRQSGLERDEVKSPASWLFLLRSLFQLLDPLASADSIAVCVVVAQSCPPLCNPVDCSPPGSSVHGIPRQEYWSGLPCAPLGDRKDRTWVFCIAGRFFYHLSHQGSLCWFYYCISKTTSLRKRLWVVQADTLQDRVLVSVDGQMCWGQDDGVWVPSIVR